MDTVSISTAQYGCFACNFTGLKVVHHQGQTVSPPLPGSTGTNFYYASTLYVTCDCCITYSMPYVPPPSPIDTTPWLPYWTERYEPHIIPTTVPMSPQPPGWLP
jgi:hypothetical protein